MINQPIQPELTKVTTEHNITYKGYIITIKGKHEYKFAKISKMQFSIHCKNHGVSFGSESTKTFTQKLNYILETVIKAEKYKIKSDTFRNLYRSLSTSEKIKHTNFAYARFQNSGLGNYYNLYWKSELSPTGVELIGGCDENEWETISKETGNSNNYYSPTENKMTAR